MVCSQRAEGEKASVMYGRSDTSLWRHGKDVGDCPRMARDARDVNIGQGGWEGRGDASPREPADVRGEGFEGTRREAG